MYTETPFTLKDRPTVAYLRDENKQVYLRYKRNLDSQMVLDIDIPDINTWEPQVDADYKLKEMDNSYSCQDIDWQREHDTVVDKLPETDIRCA